jgi:tetratricopeptide (TPR) repeat protein
MRRTVCGEVAAVTRPDPATVSSPAEFVGALRRLKQWTGLGYRQLERRAADAGELLPRSTLTAALSRDTLPREDLVVTLTRTCGCGEDEVASWVAARRRLAAAPRSSLAPGSERMPVPAQLPVPVTGFVGRTRELAALAGAAQASVITIAGSAGVGKTTLAVHWAHRVAERFPDGQLYLNLSGFDPSRTPTDPVDALRGLLTALGVRPERIPETLSARVDLYRSLLAGRRVLVLLDNARDTEQVRPLLPGAPGCLALVTSRNQLTGLLVTEAARHIPLDLLDPAEAKALLAERLGADRLAAEPAATRAIVELCARLPLALAIVAARAMVHPGFSLAALADELRAAAGGFDAFGDDGATDLPGAFSWSYNYLKDDAARLFRLLGLHPGPDITAAAAASLAGTPVGETRRLLAELTRTHLVTEHAPGRFSSHDLLRWYADQLAHSRDSARDRRAALERVLDHYLHSAYGAEQLLSPHRDPIPLRPAGDGVVPEVFPDADQAIQWFEAEHAVLLAAGRFAAEQGFETYPWQLAWSLTTFLRRRGYWQDAATIQEAALAAAERLDDHTGRAHAHRGLAHALTRLGRYEQAEKQFARAVEVFAELDDTAGLASTHLEAALVFERTSRYADALAHARRSYQLFRVAADTVGEGRSLNAIGRHHAQLGEYDQALTHCRRALALLQGLDGPAGEADIWESLGYAHHRLGDHTQAVDCYQRALVLLRSIGHRYNEASTLVQLGDAQHAAGDPVAATAAWTTALDILDQLGHHTADQVRSRLRRR